MKIKTFFCRHCGLLLHDLHGKLSSGMKSPTDDGTICKAREAGLPHEYRPAGIADYIGAILLGLLHVFYWVTLPIIILMVVIGVAAFVFGIA